MNEPTSGRTLPAAFAVRLAATWLLTGALFKLFAGTPKLLPPLVRDHSPFDWDLTFHLAIAIELSIVWFAMLKPHLAWPVISAVFAFFLVVLTDQLVAGAESCGCLGDSVKMSPALMMAIDGSLLAFVLATRPWRHIRGPGLSTALLALGVAASIGAPWLVIKTSKDVTGGTQAGTTTQGARYLTLTPTSWIGKTIYDVDEFTKWVPAEKIPTDGRIVLWRQGCTHCAQHLREMANEKDETQLILLVQVLDDLKDSRAVDAMPTGAHVTQLTLPEGMEGMFTTPVEILVEGGVVKSALYEEDFEKRRGTGG